jgi:hypothetical protein
LCLTIDGCVYRPIEVKIIDMPVEYHMFFGKTYTRFKTAYLVKFDARDIAGNYLITSGARSLELWFTSADRRVKMEWCFDEHGRVIYNDIKQPDVLAYDLSCNG